MFRDALLLIALLWSVMIPAIAQSTDEALDECPDPLRIVTWNIENFTVSRGEDEATLETLVAVWERINADVIALQEIGSENAIQLLLAAVAAQTDRHYEFALNRRGTQRVGFAWDSDRVEPLDDPEELRDVALNNLRPAFVQAFTFSDYDFTLVTLHLKATQTAGSQKIRVAQSILLAQWLSERPEDADQDVIFLGDFNDYYDAENLDPLAQVVYFTADILPEDTISYIGDDFESLIDHVALTDGVRDEFCSLQVFDPADIALSEDEFEALASDHLPVIAVFSTTNANDSE